MNTSLRDVAHNSEYFSSYSYKSVCMLCNAEVVTIPCHLKTTG